jgi:large subunit ribosomal protein L25
MAYTIKAEKRVEAGKSHVRKLRRSGRLPAVMYGHGDPSTLLSLSTMEFTRLLHQIRGHSPIVEMEIDGQPAGKCVIKTVQRNPVNDQFLHVDFQKVHPHEKLTMNVPVVIKGTPTGVKQGGMLELLLREIPVRATVDRIPEFFEIDVTQLKTGQSIHLSDIKTEGLEFVLPLDSPIVTVLTPRKLAAAAEAAAAPAPTEAAEPEVITEKKAEETAEPAEGEKKKAEKKEEKGK